MTKTFWAQDLDTVKAAVDFFIANVDSKYISHGEVESGRAIDFSTWSPDCRDILIEEFSQCLVQSEDHVSVKLAIMMDGNVISSIALMTIVRNSRLCFAILEDIITRVDRRGLNLGKKLFHWMEGQLKVDGVKKMFLESGLHNKGAQKFLKRLGFHTCSISMTKDIV